MFLANDGLFLGFGLKLRLSDFKAQPGRVKELTE